VDGKMLRIRDTLIFRDMQGNELARIQERIARIKDTMRIEGPQGQTLAVDMMAHPAAEDTENLLHFWGCLRLQDRI
jgi:uncharacterized protein YxjI